MLPGPEIDSQCPVRAPHARSATLPEVTNALAYSTQFYTMSPAPKSAGLAGCSCGTVERLPAPRDTLVVVPGDKAYLAAVCGSERTRLSRSATEAGTSSSLSSSESLCNAFIDFRIAPGSLRHSEVKTGRPASHLALRPSDPPRCRRVIPLKVPLKVEMRLAPWIQGSFSLASWPSLRGMSLWRQAQPAARTDATMSVSGEPVALLWPTLIFY